MGVETLPNTTAFIVLYFCVEPNKKWDVDSVYNMQEWE